MFLGRLSRPQQDAFFEVAWRLLAVDGVTVEEEDALRGLRAELSLPEAWSPDPQLPLSTLLETLRTDSAPQAVLLELIGLAHADSTYTSAESAFIDIVASTLQISSAWLERADDWVRQQLALSSEAMALLEDR